MSQPITTAIPTFILTPGGIIPTPYQASSLAAAVAHEPRGVYTVARTFHADHALLFDAHLDRLEESARLVDIPLHLDRDRLRAAMRDLLHQAGYPDAKFRLTVPGETPDQIYFAFERLNPVPEAILRQGAHVVTSPIVRENPVAKTTDWMVVRQPTFNSLPPGVYEAILVSKEGRVLEGLSSNFYGVLDGVLYTANEDVLGGITRKALLEILPEIVPVSLTALRQDDLPRLSDAMLTSSSRGVVPITRINHQPVGDGAVTPLVMAIKDRYDAWTEAHIEPI
jgi:branched-subunit amino acid aminotransferase/4-amino-4-deoxychorismate lyase